MKKTIAILIITILTFACIATATAEVGDRGEFYPLLTVVVGYERIGDTDEWIIDCMDKDGRVWSFYGEEEDAHVGIMFNLLMWNMGEAEEDDEIIEAYYEGRMDTMQMMQWMRGE